MNPNVFQEVYCYPASRGEREFPFPPIPGNTSLRFPSPLKNSISLPFLKSGNAISNFHPAKRNLWQGIRAGNARILYILVLHTVKLTHEIHDNFHFSESRKCWYNSHSRFPPFPGIAASNFPSLPIAKFHLPSLPKKTKMQCFISRSFPVKRECDFQFPFPFPGAKKPFPLTPGW